MKLIFILFLLTLPLVHAQQFYAGWSYPGDTFEQDGDLYAVKEGNSPYTIALQKNDATYVLNYGDCQVSHDGLERYCYTQSDYVDCDRNDYVCPDDNPTCCPHDVTNVRFSAGGVHWGVYLTMEKITPEITVTRTVDQAELSLGELARVKLTLKNDGESAITGALLYEKIPLNITYHVGDLDYRDGIATKKINLNPGQTVTYFYTLKADHFGTNTLLGNLTYTYKGDERVINTGDMNINVPSPYEIIVSLQKSSINIRDTTQYSYTVRNNEDEKLTLEIIIDGLAGIVDDAPRDAKRDGDLYVISGRLDENSEEVFRFDLHADHTGIFNIISNATIRFGTQEFYAGNKQELAVNIDLPKPEIKSTPQVFKVGEPASLQLYLNNRESSSSFSNIKAQLSGPGVNKLFTFGAVQSGDAPLIGNLNVIAPTTEATYTLYGSYQSTSKEVFNFSISKTIQVDDSNLRTKHIITQTLNQTNLYPNSSVKVKIKVKNYFPEYRSISVQDIIPAGFEVTGGLTDNQMSLNKDEEREAYTYTLKIPADFTGSQLPIQTEVIDKLSGEKFTAQMNASIMQPDPEPQINETIEVVEPTPNQDTTKEEKPGFFKRLFSGIGNFFGSLFS